MIFYYSRIPAFPHFCLMKLRYSVLLTPLVPLLICLGLALRDPEGLVAQALTWRNWLLEHFDWMFSWSFALFIPLLAVVYFSSFGRSRIGGAAAERLLPPFRWFAITVCTTIASGILFWGTAEPLYHLTAPPTAGAEDPAVFALSTLFLHWTFTPYAMYTVGGLLFAVGFYNRGQPFALSALVEPLLGKGAALKGGAVVDAICLFAMVAGMAASLGAGSLALASGLGTGTGPGGMAIVIAGVVLAFVASAVSGLQRGIRILSTVNIIGFILLAVFVFAFLPIGDTLSLAGRAFVDYLVTFPQRNFGLDPGISTEWSHDWTVFYWANWYAWAPISALFLGRLARGYTVRQFILVNFVGTAVFSIFWMVIFGGGSLVVDAEAGALSAALAAEGPEAVGYALLAELPLAQLSSAVFLLLVFLSYVTAADSNVSAMSALCVVGIRPDNAEAPLVIKIIWGLIIGLLAWTMVSYAGLDGIRLISTLGGFPAMLLILLAGLGLLRLALTKA